MIDLEIEKRERHTFMNTFIQTDREVRILETERIKRNRERDRLTDDIYIYKCRVEKDR